MKPAEGVWGGMPFKTPNTSAQIVWESQAIKAVNCIAWFLTETNADSKLDKDPFSVDS